MSSLFQVFSNETEIGGSVGIFIFDLLIKIFDKFWIYFIFNFFINNIFLYYDFLFYSIIY